MSCGSRNAVDEWLRANVGRLAELMAVNGGPSGPSADVRGREIGRPVATDHNRWGRSGLTVPEAFELTYLAGALSVLTAGMSPEARGRLREEILREVRGEVIEIATGEVAKRLLAGGGR